MSLIDKIKADLIVAIKGKKELDTLVLRQLSAEILNKEKEKRYKLSKEGIEGEELEKNSHLSDEEIVNVISYEAKKRRESMVEFEKGKRDDLVAKEKAELEILVGYLPEQFSEEEVRSMVQEAVKNSEATTIKDTGKVMAELMPKIKGRADGALVGRMVKELLS